MSNTTAYCTTATSNLLDQVQVLADSIRETDPDGRLTVLIPDICPPDIVTDQFRVLSLGDLGIENLRRQTFRYTIFELATSVKPRLLLRMLEEYERVLFLDPDVLVTSDLSTLQRDMAPDSILLTPHFVTFERSDLCETRVAGALSSGVFNSGMVGVSRGPECLRFLDWWAAYLERCALNRVSMRQFTDQKVLDLAPAIFPNLGITRDPGVNFAIWNLFERKLEKTDGRWVVDGELLKFFHYSGFKSPAAVQNMHLGRLDGEGENPVLRSHRVPALRREQQTIPPSVAELVGIVIDRLQAARILWGQSVSNKVPFTQMSDGTPIHAHTRLTYHLDPELQESVENPFDDNDLLKLNKLFRLRTRLEQYSRTFFLGTLINVMIKPALERVILGVIHNGRKSAGNVMPRDRTSDEALPLLKNEVLMRGAELDQ